MNGRGIVYLLFCWTFIPAIVSFIEAIVLLSTDDQTFNARYNMR
jgi:TM2 domain-containing membrane protein YozV